jgi:hypothetical protein
MKIVAETLEERVMIEKASKISIVVDSLVPIDDELRPLRMEQVVKDRDGGPTGWRPAPSPMLECDICSGAFKSLYPVMMIDGADKNYPMEIMHVCEHCYDSECNAPGWGWSNDYNDPSEYELVDGEWRWKGASGD